MRHEQGFSYPIVMFLVAVLAIISVRAMENSLTAARRDKEAELLSVGQAYRKAIKAYYDGSPGTAKVYPSSLDDLLLDARGTQLRRPLRKRFRDPITGSAEWGLVRDESGAIKGIYSLSPSKPFKTGGFPVELGHFTQATQYRQWTFEYTPPK
ncbi:type II secretion system protein [Massilia sp. CCM 9210]|uniref:type II secretion system protein n=1 Tax=Massilia scottii TaxID=3057166 RepID=UPI00279682B1|nr:type II secretion system protein [Massilia sp. CCM 9210]MDQ1813301.1 type II secretion system protein [Massilia sp. CCM 9210]